MASRNHTMVTVHGRKSGKSGHGGGKKKIRHMLIRPVANGFVSEIHHEPENAKEMFMGKPDETVHPDADHMVNHVAQTFGAKPQGSPDEGGEEDEEEDEDEEEGEGEGDEEE